MKIEIDKDIVSKAILCEKNFDCLKNENHDFCKVEFSCFREVHFINCLEDNFCVYKKVFGEKFLHWNRVSLKERCLGEFVAIRELKEGESIVR